MFLISAWGCSSQTRLAVYNALLRLRADRDWWVVQERTKRLGRSQRQAKRRLKDTHDPVRRRAPASFASQESDLNVSPI